MRTAIISVRPRFATALVRGTKTIELRRRAPKLSRGDLLYVYASSPDMVLIGTATVVRVIALPLTDLWAFARDRSAVTRAEFDAYFEGLDEGVAIEVTAPREVQNVSLGTLRRLWPGFHPPQTLRFLEGTAENRLQDHLARARAA